jgi:hypothetical protein
MIAIMEAKMSAYLSAANQDYCNSMQGTLEGCGWYSQFWLIESLVE